MPPQIPRLNQIIENEGWSEAGTPWTARTGRESMASAASPSTRDTSADDAVRVIVRIRPLNEREGDAATCSPALTAQGASTVMLLDPGRTEPYTVAVDQVLDSDATQDLMFEAAGCRIVDHAMAGFNTSIFAYGQTGSGKTYTMLGDVARESDGSLSPDCGLVPRVFEALFAAIALREQMTARGSSASSLRYSVKCSFLEIYNEEVTDLLNPAATGLQIRDGDLKRGIYVQGLSENEVLNANDVLNLIQSGSENRRIAATRMNERSSRSHSVFTATLESHERTSGGVLRVRYAKMNLIDLAGSERVARSGAAGQQLSEVKSINRSLAVLARVISALVERQRRPTVHVPYRDSRLTFLLQESLGGNSRTCIIANVTPAPDSATETHSTLSFANGAKKIKCRAVVNEDRTGDARALAAENARMEKVIADLQQQLEQAQSLFDQNNTAITAMRVEQGVLRRELGEARAQASRLSEEAVQLRTENAMLNAAVVAEEEERERLLDEIEDAREAAVRAREEAKALKEEVVAARNAAAEVAGEVAEARATRAAVESLLEESKSELRRVQKEAQADTIAAASREEGLRRENEAEKAKNEELAVELEKLRKELRGEHSSVNRYKRMVGEVVRLIDWTQASPPAGANFTTGGGPAAAPALAGHGMMAATGGSKPSPAAAAALRVARMSLANGAREEGGGNATLGDATNAHNKNRASYKSVVIQEPAGRHRTRAVTATGK